MPNPVLGLSLSLLLSANYPIASMTATQASVEAFFSASLQPIVSQGYLIAHFPHLTSKWAKLLVRYHMRLLCTAYP